MWTDIIGHNDIIQSLQAYGLSGKIPHAFLFSGLKGVGKSKAAFEFFKALNCLSMPGDPCDQCKSCLKAQNFTHPDLHVIEPDGALIKVDAIRNMLAEIGLKAFEAKYRMVVVEPAEQLNEAAANALLKTLEEPPDKTIIVLISHKPRVLLPTIRSRCQEIRFNPIDATLSHGKIDPAVFKLTAGTLGGLGDDEMKAIGGMRAALAGLFTGADPLACAAKASTGGTQAQLWLTMTESFMRDIFLLGQGGGDLIHQELLELSGRQFSYDRCDDILDCIQRIRRGIKQSINQKVAFNELFLKVHALVS